jgi:hypothetical protein
LQCRCSRVSHVKHTCVVALLKYWCSFWTLYGNRGCLHIQLRSRRTCLRSSRHAAIHPPSRRNSAHAHCCTMNAAHAAASMPAAPRPSSAARAAHLDQTWAAATRGAPFAGWSQLCMGRPRRPALGHPGCPLIQPRLPSPGGVLQGSAVTEQDGEGQGT